MLGPEVKPALAPIAVTCLSGCVSSEMNGLVGRPVEHAQQRFGVAEKVIPMPGVRVSGG